MNVVTNAISGVRALTVSTAARVGMGSLIGMNAAVLPDVFRRIFEEAFGIRQVASGGFGAVIMNGVKRGSSPTWPICLGTTGCPRRYDTV